MFAPLYHGATARVAGIRRQLGIHTTFNLLGPLSNPAGAPRQIIGVWRKDLTEPEDFGLSRSSLDHLRGGDAAAHAEIIREVLGGRRRDEARDLVIINAAAALFVGGCRKDLKAAASLAAESIDSGAALKKLDCLIKETNN
jgi:anthranilate phosphoribosyltransferase